MPEPDAAVGHAQLVPWHTEQPGVRAIVLAALFGRHVAGRARVQRSHHVGRGAGDQRLVSRLGPADHGRHLHVPWPRALSAVGRPTPSRHGHPGQQPLFRVLRQTVPAERRVRGRHAYATAIVDGNRPGQFTVSSTATTFVVVNVFRYVLDSERSEKCTDFAMMRVLFFFFFFEEKVLKLIAQVF